MYILAKYISRYFRVILVLLYSRILCFSFSQKIKFFLYQNNSTRVLVPMRFEAVNKIECPMNNILHITISLNSDQVFTWTVGYFLQAACLYVKVNWRGRNGDITILITLRSRVPLKSRLILQASEHSVLSMQCAICTTEFVICIWAQIREQCLFEGASLWEHVVVSSFGRVAHCSWRFLAYISHGSI